MANKEFNNIEEFIDGFTREGPTPEQYIYDGVIWGMDFLYKERIFRITRDTASNESELQERFHKTKNAYIQLYEIPKNIYPQAYDVPLEYYLGIFESVYDLLNQGAIDGVPLKDIIASSEAEILSID